MFQFNSVLKGFCCFFVQTKNLVCAPSFPWYFCLTLQIMIRFIEDFSHDAAFNMAADQFLLDQCSENETVFIRFYSWAVPSITLGYMQKPYEVLDLNMVTKNAVSWIKRPTGGRAVLHFEDLTYSCIFPNSMNCMGTTVQQSYQIITNGLVHGLVLAGIDCCAHDSYEDFLSHKREIKLPCFLAPNKDEVMVNGKKLVGSAQRRSEKGVLQHGSIPFSSFYRTLPLYLNESQKQRDHQRELLEKKSICIWDINRNLDNSSLIEALKNGFISTLKMPWIKQGWTSQELETIRKRADSEEFKKQWLS